MSRIVRAKKYKTRKASDNGSAKQILLVALLAVLIFCYAQFSVYRPLQDAVSGAQAVPALASSSSVSRNMLNEPAGSFNTDHGDYKFIIVHKIREAQGAGNHMHGLLAAHLLADEFQRIVCVAESFKDFHLAFEHVDKLAVEHCPDILRRHNKEPPGTRIDHTIELLNYRMTAPNECALKEKLSSSARVLHLISNTYPRWPRVPNHINFFAFYKAKPLLLDILPYPPTQPPPIVVHLRHADKSGGDRRKGVDDESLRALGKIVPVDVSQHSPFLVTNNVAWYNMFETQFGWSHSEWEIVMHSALGYQWEGRLTEGPRFFGGNSDKVLLQKKYKDLRTQMGVDAWETIQLWADWYTLVRAEKVYHTFSDFSLSAVHWSKAWSRTYDGISPKTGKLILLEENWIADGESPRLVDRTPDQLKNCNVKRRCSMSLSRPC